jgi:hypothetical protein
MAMSGWLRALDTIRGLLDLGQRLRGPSAGGSQPGYGGASQAPGDAMTSSAGGAIGAPGTLEARLAGVLVAALKEAFDRDRARLDMEKAEADAVRRQADDAIRVELRRQEGDRAVAHARLVAILAVVAWIVSAALLVLVPGTHAGLARAALATGWAVLFGSLGTAFASYHQATSWLGRLRPGGADPGEVPAGGASRASGALLILGFALIAVALLTAL